MPKLIVSLQYCILHQGRIWLFNNPYWGRVFIIIVSYCFLISTSSLYLKWLFIVESFSLHSIERKGIVYQSYSRSIEEAKYKTIGKHHIEITERSYRAFERRAMADGNIKWKRSMDCGVDYWQPINSYSDETKLLGIVTLMFQNQPNCGPSEVNRPLKNSLNS